MWYVALVPVCKHSEEAICQALYDRPIAILGLSHVFFSIEDFRGIPCRLINILGIYPVLTSHYLQANSIAEQAHCTTAKMD